MMPFAYPRIVLFDVLLGLSSCVVATNLPYNPTRILLSGSDEKAIAWVLSPESSSTQSQLLMLDISETIDTTSTSPTTVYSTLPFLNSTNNSGYTPVIAGDGTITVLSGNCNQGYGGSETWQLALNHDQTNGTWTQISIDTDAGASGDETVAGSNFLSAGINFPANADLSQSSIYVFGGMCPSPGSSIDSQNWTSAATYSNDMISLAPVSEGQATPGQVNSYDLTQSGSRGAPIAEAGLTITPLSPTYSNSTDGGGTESEQQNFVLIGGHTQQAFINMSQVALFSLPEQSWSFVSIDQPSNDSRPELAVRDSNTMNVEPRSGHTAVLTPDGSKIIVFGGWVGDIDTPATPQLAILEVGSGYGGTGDWIWTSPSTTSSPFQTGEGIYGHGAAMLQGGVMLVMGGYTIPASTSSRFRNRRQTSSNQGSSAKIYLFNTTSNAWVSSYDASINSTTGSTGSADSPGALHTASQKAGLGAGLALGCSSVAGLVAVFWWYSRRLRLRREARERELRELALGAHRYQSDILHGGIDGRGGYPEMQTNSSIKRKPVPAPQDSYPWAPLVSQSQASRMGPPDEVGRGEREAERTGLLVEFPSPTRGLRRSLYSRGPASSTFGSVNNRGAIHTIDERGEYEDHISERGASIKRSASAEPAKANTIRMSDPFKDAPPQLGAVPSVGRSPSDAKRQRTAEIQGWVDDWSAAAAAMELSRNASTSRSHSHSHSHSMSTSGRGSPDKSDRTGSNLSEASMYSSNSIQISNVGTVRRDGNARSVSAGYAQALFAGAAAAATKLYTAASGTETAEPGPSTEDPWRRARSLTLDTTAPRLIGVEPRSNTFTNTTQSPIRSHPEFEGLLTTYNTNLTNGRSRPEDVFSTPPESPVKERSFLPTSSNLSSYTYSSLLPSTTNTDFTSPTTNPRQRTALGFLGSVRRALTGTNIPTSSAVRSRVLEYESRSSSSSPTKRYHLNNNNPSRKTTNDSLHGSPMKEMAEIPKTDSPRRAASASATFWRGRKGRRDWLEDSNLPPSSTPLEPSRLDPPIRVPPDKRHRWRDEEAGEEGEEDGDWDPETAIQNRLVQVMFTVPKEKLRVVNAETLSLSDVDFEGGERDTKPTETGGRVLDGDKGKEVVR